MSAREGSRKLEQEGFALGFFVLHAVVPVALGAGLYLTARSRGLLVFDWVAALGVAEVVDDLRQLCAPWVALLPAWARYSLPNAMWAYALTACMLRIWSGSSARGAAALWISLGPALSLGWELGQALHLVPGTFDFTDLFFVLGALVLAFLVSLRSRSRRKLGAPTRLSSKTSKTTSKKLSRRTWGVA